MRLLGRHMKIGNFRTVWLQNYIIEFCRMSIDVKRMGSRTYIYRYTLAKFIENDNYVDRFILFSRGMINCNLFRLCVRKRYPKYNVNPILSFHTIVRGQNIFSEQPIPLPHFSNCQHSLSLASACAIRLYTNFINSRGLAKSMYTDYYYFTFEANSKAESSYTFFFDFNCHL